MTTAFALETNPAHLHIPNSVEQLHDAFETFNKMSEQLSTSYQILESKVIELSGELATVSEQRMQELSEKERLADQLESLLQILPAAVVVIDKMGCIMRSNLAADQLVAHLLDEPCTQLVNLPWSKVILQCFQPQKNDGHEISLKDGKLVSVATCSLGEEGQLILITDQTETRALQDKVNHHKRLSEMGQMVASLAHQIRTPLSAAMLYAGNLSKESLSKELTQKFAGKIQNRLSHIEQQIQDMLIFVRGEIQLIDEVSSGYLGYLIEQSAGDISLNHDCTIRVNHHMNNCYVNCNQESLISAISNLLNNACEAKISGCEIEVNFVAGNECLEIYVKDNGVGIDEDKINKIFEPFFTTKAQGTGLGLAVVKAIITAHKGDIQVRNHKIGCEFIITLPMVGETI
ncbi:MAG: ATP-binding protein [Saccharospirillaceae bacterium]|nr:ATP-binding protein [Pseudomonadales bacterium]NRB81460.1 ATP-binding protein [Saccharospirillaceae bacterium]